MSYVNFKEERFVANNQLEKRIKNNKRLFENIKRSKNISNNYNPDKKYSFRDFNNYTFGGEPAKDESNFKEIINKDIVCTIFNNCKFYNVKFKNCRFIGCYFTQCDFGSGGVLFESCIFIKEESDKLPSLNKRDNFSCTFEMCNIYGRFINCSLNYVIFNRCNMKDTNFELSDMTSTMIVDSHINMIILIDVDLSGFKIVNTYIENLEFRDKYKSKIDEKTFIDKIPLRKKTREEYEGIYVVYQNFADKFMENDFKNNFGEYYYLGKKTQFKVIKPIPKVVSFLNWVTCGYGERPLFAVYSSLLIIILFSFLFLLGGIDIDGEIIKYGITNTNFNIMKFISDFNESLNLSVGMFAGIGFNNAQPIPKTYMLSNIEMLLGVVMMGIGIGTLTKKLVR